ncbi:hypothetical protein AYI69_g6620, partial [Smittium culicis]
MSQTNLKINKDDQLYGRFLG